MDTVTHRLLTACAVVISISALAQGTPRYTLDGDLYNYDDGYVLVDSTGNAGGYTRYWGYDNASQIVNGLLVLHRQLRPSEVLVDEYSFPEGVVSVPPPGYQGRFSVFGTPLVASPFSSTIRPILGIVPAGNTNILFWPTNTTGTNYVLQSATNLASPNWLTATDTLVVAYGSQLAVSVTNSSAARFFRLSLVPPTTNGMVLIPAGSFTMGNCMDPGEGNSAELPLHTANVSAFYMDTNLITYALWTNVYQWATNHGYNFDTVGSCKATNHPVLRANWYDAVKWCNARSEMAGLTPCYYTNASLSEMSICRSGQFDLDTNWVSWVANGYRLPTEAEWEKAARGGAAGHRFPWSDADTIDWSRANYNSYWSGGVPYYPYDVNPTSGYDTNFTSGGTPYTSPVGSFAPNGYGLYDMAGNVWEWCWDCYDGAYYSSSPATDPRGPASSPNSDRLLRGGFWDNNASLARCAVRRHSWPSNANVVIGFRCVKGH
jgi:formylglycine-generating enzyme